MDEDNEKIAEFCAVTHKPYNNYFKDLNALHDAEWALTLRGLYAAYCENLLKVTAPAGILRWALEQKIRQRQSF